MALNRLPRGAGDVVRQTRPVLQFETSEDKPGLQNADGKDARWQGSCCGLFETCCRRRAMTSKLNEIRKRERAAAKGPWHYEFINSCLKPHHIFYNTREGGRHNALLGLSLDPLTEANFKFAAHARSDIPYLLSLVERLAGALKEYVESNDAAQLENGGIGGETEDIAKGLLSELDGDDV